MICYKQNNINMETKITKTCAYCGKEFEDTRSNRIYCSDSCTKKASYHINKKKKIEKESVQDVKGNTNNVFMASEYKAFKKYLKENSNKPNFPGCKDVLSFYEFCFFRKDIKGAVNFELFVILYDQYLIDDIRDKKDSPIYKEYEKFITDFNRGTYSIDTSIRK